MLSRFEINSTSSMKKTSTVLCVALLTGLIACDDHRTPPEAVSTCPVVKRTLLFPSPSLPYVETVNYNNVAYNLGLNDYQTFTYDEQGRVSQSETVFSVNPQQANSKSTYEYSPTQIKETRYASNGTSSQINYSLNNQGLIASGNGSTYQYDNNGYLVKSTSATTERTYTITNGNLVEQVEVVKTPAATTTRISQYEYDQSKPGFTAALQQPYYLIEPGYQAIAPYFGKNTRNLLTKSTTSIATVLKDGTPFKSNSVATFIYTYDQRGQIIRTKSVINNTIDEPLYRDENITVNDFTYGCAL